MNGPLPIGYPTLGEVLRFVFNAMAVLPEKRDLAPDFDCKERRNVQKLLERLAEEKGDVSENAGKAMQQLAYLVAGYIESPSISLAVGEVINDLLDVYRQVIREEGTYLSGTDTLRWMIAERWAGAAAASIVRNITRFGLRTQREYFPDDPQWYLPDTEDGKLTLPLAKVMRWIYVQAGLSQTQFHYPQRQADERDAGRKHDLENAQNWYRGRRLPSAAALDWTFGRGFASAQARAGATDAASAKMAFMRQNGIRTALFLARCISFASIEMRKNFGDDFLRRTVKTFVRTLFMALEDAQDAEDWIVTQARSTGCSLDDPELRSYAYECWIESLKQRASLADDQLQSLLQSGALDEAEVERMVATYGPLAVLPSIEMLRAPSAHVVPEGFPEALYEGLALGRERELSGERIDAYHTRLAASGMDGLLAWMVPWLRFQVCYRCDDHAQAWAMIEQAFEFARYRAGSHQYVIVNHYIELAAKLGKALAFRKGVYWSRYIGIEVRWLRDKELTQENLDFLMTMMSKARYVV